MSDGPSDARREMESGGFKMAPKKRIKNTHRCGRCGAEFFSKAKCWYHMDFECPKRKQKP